MDRFEAYIEKSLKGIVNRQRKAELKEELRDHLLLSKNEFLEQGLSETEAEDKAIEQFGNPKKIRKGFMSVFTPYFQAKELLYGHKKLREALKWSVSLAGALLISLSFRSYAFASAVVEQRSMQNTLVAGQKLIESKVDYYFGSPERGDIVIINQNPDKGVINSFVATTEEFFKKFNQKDDEKVRLVKRVIGLPGETLDVKDGSVTINGKPLDEPYIKGVTEEKSVPLPIVIPKNKYFVMGDNREESFDSRQFGLIDISEIEGKAIFRFWPFDKIGPIDR